MYIGVFVTCQIVTIMSVCGARLPVQANTPFEPDPFEPATHSVAKNSDDYLKNLSARCDRTQRGEPLDVAA